MVVRASLRRTRARRAARPGPGRVGSGAGGGAGDDPNGHPGAERSAGLAATRRVADAGAVAAVGHTDTIYEQAGRRSTPGRPWVRTCSMPCGRCTTAGRGPAIALLEDARVTVEMITDGVHLHPALYREVRAGVGPAESP